MKIADIIRKGIADGQTNEQVLAAVLKAHPEANTNANCVNWYRNKAKKQVSAVVEKAKREAPKPIAAPISTKDEWSAKITKTFRGMEGGGFNANLMLNGKTVCVVIDDACGGQYLYDWADADAPFVSGKQRCYDDALYAREMTPLEKRFHDHVNAMPKYDSFGREAAMTADVFVGELLEAVELKKTLKSLTKGKIAFVTLDNKVYTQKGELNDAIRKQIASKFSGAIILNELSEVDAIARLNVLAGN